MRQPDLSEPLVSVVAPANNEAGTVPVLVEKTAKTFAGLGRPWELVYVDDGSSDGTAAAVAAEAAVEPRSGWSANAVVWVD
jgi:glycosyltransferase involved in cell wall biosynthesis